MRRATAGGEVIDGVVVDEGGDLIDGGRSRGLSNCRRMDPREEGVVFRGDGAEVVVLVMVGEDGGMEEVLAEELAELEPGDEEAEKQGGEEKNEADPSGGFEEAVGFEGPMDIADDERKADEEEEKGPSELKELQQSKGSASGCALGRSDVRLKLGPSLLRPDARDNDFEKRWKERAKDEIVFGSLKRPSIQLGPQS